MTRISGGHADNVVPDRCDILFDRRMIPGENEAAVKRELQDLLDRARRQSGVEAEIADTRPRREGRRKQPAHPIVAAAKRACARHGVEDVSPQGFQGGCDLVHFRSAGAQGLVLGPGSLAVAHKPDEFVPLDELFQACRIYRDIAIEMLGGDPAAV